MSKTNKFTGESNAKNRRLEQSEQHTYSASQFTADLTMQEVDQFRNYLSSMTSKGRGVEFQSLRAGKRPGRVSSVEHGSASLTPRQ